jgi:hypothetical protein
MNIRLSLNSNPVLTDSGVKDMVLKITWRKKADAGDARFQKYVQRHGGVGLVDDEKAVQDEKEIYGMPLMQHSGESKDDVSNFLSHC